MSNTEMNTLLVSAVFSGTTGLRIETFEGPEAWTDARDWLVDDAIDTEREASSRHSHTLENISTILCDADPDEDFRFAHAGITVIISMAGSTAEERFCVEDIQCGAEFVVIDRNTNAPMGTFSTYDSFGDEDSEDVDEGANDVSSEDACANAKLFAKTLNVLLAAASTPRYTISHTDNATWIVLDKHIGAEIARTDAFETKDRFLTEADARSRAQSIADALNASAFDWKPQYEEI